MSKRWHRIGLPTSGTSTHSVSAVYVTVYYRKRRWWRRVWEALRDDQ